MTIKLNMIEVTEIVGVPDAKQTNTWWLGTFDTLSHAVRVSDERENELVDKTHAVGGWSTPVTDGAGTHTEYSVRVVGHGRPFERGDVIRTTRLQITL